MAAYAQRHYGLDTWRLVDPRVIVEHYTANESFSVFTNPRENNFVPWKSLMGFDNLTFRYAANLSLM